MITLPLTSITYLDAIFKKISFPVFLAALLSSCSADIPVSDMKTIGLNNKLEPLFPADNLQDCNITKYRMEIIKNYIISVDNHGNYEPITLDSESELCGAVEQPKSTKENLRETGISLHTKNITNALFSQDESITHILIYIHGGLNSPKESRSRAIEESNLISQYIGRGKYEGRKYFPIFINWHSEGLDTYANQILHVRQGNEVSDIRGITTAPLYFLSDSIQAIGRAPSTLEKNIARLAKTKFSEDFVKCKPDEHLEIILCEFHDRTLGEKLPRVLKFVPSFLFQLLGVLPADSFGKNAWVNMLRRTQMLLRSRNEFESQTIDRFPTSESNEFNGQGDLAYFFRTLQKEIAKRELVNPNKKYKITLIGHSMGTIIANEIARAFPNLPYEEIVYMAAACSIHDFENSIIPLLKKENAIKFYNLSLDPEAEAREYTLRGFGPTGSLLEWIDSYYTDPPTVFDMTMGKWQNIAIAKNSFPLEARKKMIFKVFAFDETSQPTKHGDMHDTNRCWWKPEYWSETSNQNESFYKNLCEVHEIIR